MHICVYTNTATVVTYTLTWSQDKGLVLLVYFHHQYAAVFHDLVEWDREYGQD